MAELLDDLTRTTSCDPAGCVVLDARERWGWRAQGPTFAGACVAGGHGVAPIALILVHGWDLFPVEVAAGWVGILLLLASAWTQAALAPVLALIGTIVLVGSWVALQARSDAPLATVLSSLPFLGCTLVHAIHLARIRGAVSVRPR